MFGPGEQLALLRLGSQIPDHFAFRDLHSELFKMRLEVLHQITPATPSRSKLERLDGPFRWTSQ